MTEAVTEDPIAEWKQVCSDFTEGKDGGIVPRLIKVGRAMADEIERLREVVTFPIITPEASSSALFIRVLSEHEKGQPVNGQDLINALMWRVKNQRKEIARLTQKRPSTESVSFSPNFDERNGIR